jgi:hypothetical protein
MSDLMQKLAQSNARALMSNDTTPRRDSYSNNMTGNYNITEDYDMPSVKYNIPQEFLQESPSQTMSPYLSSLPVENTKPVGVPTVDAIKNSKLPDEIKKLMMEHPIAQPQQPTVTMSDELIEKSRRLMGGSSEKNYIPESSKKQPTIPSSITQKQSSNVGIDYKLIQKMINEAVNNALKQNGLITESSEKSNETFSFKVGKHVFEGKVTKIKKLS